MSKKSAVLNDLQQDEIIKILLKDNSNEIINKIIFDVDTGNFTAQSIILNNQLEELQKRDMNDTNIQKEISKIKNQIYRTELFDEIGRIIKIRLNTKQPILPPKGLKKLEQLKQLHNPIEHESEKEKALQSVFSFSAPKTIQPPLPPPSESEIENNTVKEILDITPSVLRKKPKDPFTKEREPGSGPVTLLTRENVGEVMKELDFQDLDDHDKIDTHNEDFELMDIEEEERRGGKRRRRKMKTRKAVRKNKRKRSTKKRRTSVRRR